MIIGRPIRIVKTNTAMTQIEPEELRRTIEDSPNLTKNGGTTTGSDAFEAGCLRRFSNLWSNAPKSIQKIIQGYSIPFLKKPPIIKFETNFFEIL